LVEIKTLVVLLNFLIDLDVVTSPFEYLLILNQYCLTLLSIMIHIL
jgi:hypothetical protein